MDAFDNDSITWGRVAKSLYKGNSAYLSFFYEGQEYELYENFYLHDEGASEPHVGKVVALWEEKKTGRKRMLVRWFFRPTDLVLLGLDSNSKELFLAFGEGKGVMNENDLEVILQRCKVLCTSKGSQNIQPSENDIKNADYYFYRIYDVNRKCLFEVDKVAKKLGFDAVFNKQTWVSSGRERPLISEDSDILKSTEVKKEANAISATVSMLVGKEDVPRQPGSSKGSEEKKDSKPVSNGISDVQGGILPSNEEDISPSRNLQQESKKRARESDIVSGVPKKRLSAEVPLTKKGNDSSGLKRPKRESSEDGNEKKRLKVSTETKTSTSIENASVALSTSPALPDALASTVKLNEDLQTERMTTLHSLKTEDNAVVIEDIQDIKEATPISGIPAKLSDASATATELKGDIQGEGRNDSQFLVAEHSGAEKAIQPKEEEVQGEQESKLVSLETEKPSKLGDITLKSSVTSSRADGSIAKPIRVTEDGECVADVENEHKQVSAVPEPLLAKAQKEKDNVSKKVASQEGKAMQKPLVKPTSNSKEEGGTGGRGENRKVVEMRKVVQGSSHKKEEIENKRVERSTKAVGTKLIKTSKVTTNNMDGKELKDLERFTSETAMAKKLKSGEQVKLSEKIASLKGKDEARVQLKSALTTSGNVRPDLNLEKRSIFKQLPWEENISQGLPQGRVLLVSNFSPSFTSFDVCDMLKSVFKGCSDARLISQRTASPYGKALVIFHNRGLAESAMQEMEEKCLVLTDSNRPLIASVAEPPAPSKVSRFPGHFPLEKFKMSRQHDNEEMRKAVSTSHCSQPNTIEFEMAMEWRQHQEMVQKCWDDLFKRQDDEVDVVLRKHNKQKPMNARL
eukprot:c29082_g1_i1 orf=551-3115(-)